MESYVSLLVVVALGLGLVVFWARRSRKRAAIARANQPKSEPWRPPEFTVPALRYVVGGVLYTYLGSSQVAGHEYRNTRTGQFVRFTVLWKQLSKADRDAYMAANPTYNNR